MNNDIFSELFGSNFNAGIQPEDRDKAKALLAVVCKSTASLADVYQLAESLGLQLRITATSKPKPKTRAAA